ncbi:hypothetical protein [Halorubrum gandharaense]
MIKPLLYHGSTIGLGVSIIMYFVYGYVTEGMTDLLSIFFTVIGLAMIILTARDIFTHGAYDSLPSNENLIWLSPIVVLSVILLGYFYLL